VPKFDFFVLSYVPTVRPQGNQLHDETEAYPEDCEVGGCDRTTFSCVFLVQFDMLDIRHFRLGMFTSCLYRIIIIIFYEIVTIIKKEIYFPPYHLSKFQAINYFQPTSKPNFSSDKSFESSFFDQILST